MGPPTSPCGNHADKVGEIPHGNHDLDHVNNLHTTTGTAVLSETSSFLLGYSSRSIMIGWT